VTVPVNPLDALVDHVTGGRFHDLPPMAVESVKTFLLDTIGVGVAGSSGAAVDRLIQACAGWGQGSEATVWGSNVRLPAPSAAIVNAYQIHCLEFDCVHEGAVLHPMATLLSVLMAWCERRSAAGRPVSGQAMITAIAVGVDVACLLGMAARGPIQFFRPATAGGFGAVAAIASVEGFDAATLRNALGIQYGQLSGTLQPHLEGVPLLGLQIGFNARAALTSCDLAAAGFVGPHDILTGRYGYFPLYEGNQFDLADAWGQLGRVWQVTRLAHKPYPSGRLTHGAIHALRLLQAEFGVSAADISHLTAHVPNLVARLVGRPNQPNPPANYAKLCLAFTAGVWMAKGHCTVADFQGEALNDPLVHDYASRVTVIDDGNPNPNAMEPQRFFATLRRGEELSISLPHVYGHPDVPLSRAENLEKFRRCWAGACPALPAAGADAVIAWVEGLDTETDVATLPPLLTV
jgi:aconitate decarboxylase